MVFFGDPNNTLTSEQNNSEHTFGRTTKTSFAPSLSEMLQIEAKKVI